MIYRCVLWFAQAIFFLSISKMCIGQAPDNKYSDDFKTFAPAPPVNQLYPVYIPKFTAETRFPKLNRSIMEVYDRFRQKFPQGQHFNKTDLVDGRYTLSVTVKDIKYTRWTLKYSQSDKPYETFIYVANVNIYFVIPDRKTMTSTVHTIREEYKASLSNNPYQTLLSAFKSGIEIVPTIIYNDMKIQTYVREMCGKRKYIRIPLGKNYGIKKGDSFDIYDPDFVLGEAKVVDEAYINADYCWAQTQGILSTLVQINHLAIFKPFIPESTEKKAVEESVLQKLNVAHYDEIINPVLISPNPPDEISITPEYPQTFVGKKVTLKIVAKDGDKGVIPDYKPDKLDITPDGASISNESFTANKPGIYTITATDKETQKEGKTEIQVLEAPSGIEVDPSSVTLAPGEKMTFKAYICWDGRREESTVEWSANGGKITKRGEFTAGDNTGEFSVIAKHCKTESEGKAEVKIALPKYKVVVSPDNKTIHPGETVYFNANIYRNEKPFKGNIEWSVDEKCGSITKNEKTGILCAGSETGTYFVKAYDNISNTYGVAKVTIIEPGKVNYETRIEPNLITLRPGEIQLFKFRMYKDGKEFVNQENITWKATGGTIDQNGEYKAGFQEGEFTVTAQCDRKEMGYVSNYASVSIKKDDDTKYESIDFDTLLDPYKALKLHQKKICLEKALCIETDGQHWNSVDRWGVIKKIYVNLYLKNLKKNCGKNVYIYCFAQNDKFVKNLVNKEISISGVAKAIKVNEEWQICFMVEHIIYEKEERHFAKKWDRYMAKINSNEGLANRISLLENGIKSFNGDFSCTLRANLRANIKGIKSMPSTLLEQTLKVLEQTLKVLELIFMKEVFEIIENREKSYKQKIQDFPEDIKKLRYRIADLYPQMLSEEYIAVAKELIEKLKNK